MATPKGRPVAFSPGAARKIEKAVNRVLSTPRSNERRPARGGVWTYGIVRARVTTTITEGTFHAPGSGEARLYFPDDDGVWRPSGDPVEVKNQFQGGDIEVPDSILIAWIAGQWFVVAANCGDNLDETEDPPEEPEEPEE